MACTIRSLLQNIYNPIKSTTCMASGRWWPQPDATRRNFTMDRDKNDKVTANNDEIVTSTGIRLKKSEAAPVYAEPKSKTDGFELVQHKKDGEMVANYTLYEAAINKAKVPWIDYNRLTSEERDIHMKHMTAVNDRKLNYVDPKTKYTVFTISHHLKRGRCCGSGCRHCPYKMENATDEVRKGKVWNGAFYV